jgi:hypothetical protein
MASGFRWSDIFYRVYGPEGLDFPCKDVKAPDMKDSVGGNDNEVSLCILQERFVQSDWPLAGL